MVKKYSLTEAKRKSWGAWSSIPQSGLNCPKPRYEQAIVWNTDAVNYIEDAIVYHRKNAPAQSISDWQNMLCVTSFGKGLTEGLLEMKEKTYKNRYRPFQEIESVVKDFSNAYTDLASNPKIPESHLRVGNGFGRLGLAKEGKYMLEDGIRWEDDKNLLVFEPYWDRIRKYLSDKRISQ